MLDGIYPIEDMNANLKGLKFDNKTISSVAALSKCFNAELVADRVFLKKLMSKTPHSILVSALEARALKEPDNAQNFYKALSIIKEILQKNQCFTLDNLAVDGHILAKELNISGKETGFILDNLLTAVIEEECPNITCNLLKYAKTNLI